MKRGLLFSFFALAIFIGSSIVGADRKTPLGDLGGRDNGSRGQGEKPARSIGAINSEYRSPGSVRKVVIQSGDEKALAAAQTLGAVEIADYGSYRLLAVEETSGAAKNFEERKPSDPISVRDDFNVLLLRGGVIDTTAGDAPGNFLGAGKANALYNRGVGKSARPAAMADLKLAESALRIVQFVGPVKPEWLEELRASGLDPIAYVPNNGYLVRGAALAAERLIKTARAGANFVQWEGPLLPEYKVHPSLLRAAKRSGEEVEVTLQFAGGAGFDATRDIQQARGLAAQVLAEPYDVLEFTNFRIRVDASRIGQLAALEGVINIEPWSAPQIRDEGTGAILARDLAPNGKQPRGPGYMQWLQSLGLAAPMSFGIDITDTGLDRGATTPDKLHPDFLNAAGQSRVIYARDYTSELDAGDLGGHGTINASIAAGGNTSAAPGMRDSAGYNYGLGVAPFALIGTSKIFQSNGKFDLIEPYTKLISTAYRDGMRISSNSWGTTNNEYTLESQEYDARVRDADPAQPGNQEMLILFSAGNAGGGGRIDSPGSGKNVLSVAASEGFRKGGEDGCGIEDVDADDINDIAFFSGGGKVNDGRLKPDIAAPGTHIQGAASQHPEFTGSSVCGLDVEKPYFPSDQTLYTWSSGTSHAAPAVAGAAALIRQYYLNQGKEASVAFIKALLVNTTTYLTGELAAGDLPHPRQGWGLLNLNRALDSQAKILVDQTHTFGESGQEFVITGEVKDPTQPFRVTLAWTDAPGLSIFAPWVNDLDLEVTINGQVYRPNNFTGQVSQPGGEPNTKDNIEGVWLPAGTVGTFVLRVRATNVAGDGVPGNADLADQDFALVVYNAERKDAGVATLAGTNLTAGGDGVVTPGETASILVNLGNASPFTLAGGRGVLRTQTAGVTITSGEADFPTIPSGASAASQSPFSFTVAGTIACGTPINFTLDVTSNGTVTRVPFTIYAGSITPTEFFVDDVESGQAKWTVGSLIKKKKQRQNTWVISKKRFRSGASSWFTPNLGQATDSFIATQPVVLPADGRNLQLVFYHTFEFEPGGFDGGVIEIGEGDNFEDLGPKIVTGRYNGSIYEFTGNPLGGRVAWTDGRQGQLQQVVVDLSSYAGKTVVIRFRVGTDRDIKGLGWYVDDVTLHGDRVRCTPVALQ